MALTFISQLIKSDEAGFACSKSKLVAKDGVVHLRPFNINEKGQLDLAEAYMIPVEEAPQSKLGLKVGDILFNNTNSVEWVGKSALIRADIPHAFSNHMNRVRVDQNRVMPAWFHYWLEEKRKSGFFSANCTQWVSQAAYRLSSLNNTQIDLPPLDEQHRIVDILDRAASIQRLRQAADGKLKEIIPALFVDMFGDPATNSKGYTKSALGTLINIRSSVRLPDLANEAEELCIGADAISSGDGKLLFQPTVGSVMPKSGKYFFHDGDVLYSKIRPYLCKAWLADCSGYCSADIYAIECNKRLTPHFLKYLLLSKDFTDYAVAQSSRASMPKVNREALSAYEFPLPPVELQREFSALAERVLSLAKLSSEASGSGDLSMASLSSQFFNAA